MNKEYQNKFGFKYPTRYGAWSWRWPSHVAGGFKSWIFKHWVYQSKDKKSITEGVTILGFTKIDTSWNCEPEEAIKIYRNGQQKLIDWLMGGEEIWGD